MSDMLIIPEILFKRLSNQRLFGQKFKNPEDAVSWLGAVQAQDFKPALWSLGVRTAYLNLEKLQTAYNEGKILRTHIMRPTWHFVTPENVDWIQKLTSARVKQKIKTYNKKLELTDQVFKKTSNIITRALRNKNYLTRQEVGAVLLQNGIKASGQRLGHIVCWAELDGLIVNGPMKGKQFTYALLAERAPKPRKLSTEESLAELAKLYFQSHGPALTKDFSWWSGLTLADAKLGVELNKPKLITETVNGKEYWLFPNSPKPGTGKPSLFILSVYDEYFIGISDRSLMLEDRFKNQIAKVGNALLTSLVMSNGKTIGVWKKRITKNIFEINLTLFRKLTGIEDDLLKKEVQRIGKFYGMETKLNTPTILK